MTNGKWDDTAAWHAVSVAGALLSDSGEMSISWENVFSPVDRFSLKILL